MQLSQERAELLIWLNSIPSESLERLRQINRAATTSRHIVMALAMGLYDKDIARLNKMIIRLMLSRMEAERANDAARLDRINSSLGDLHFAIDMATGETRPEPVTADACRSASFRRRRDNQNQTNSSQLSPAP